MTSLDTLRDLQRRVAAASGPDREIDAGVWCFERGYVLRAWNTNTVFWSKVADGMQFNGNDMMRIVPRYTASLDAAVALLNRVLPGWWWALGVSMSGFSTKVGETIFHDKSEGDGCLPPLALCSALLSALISRAETAKAEG